MTDSNPRDISPDKKKEWESSSDFANYFCTYAFILPSEADAVGRPAHAELPAEDLGEGLAVIPEVPLTTEEVTIDDIQVDPAGP
ncbi:hypothetical protein PInf_013660 [Phytophthora infestans]|nr:hypothetical protein PInf_013660 [Phytophthora infestans]